VRRHGSSRRQAQTPSRGIRLLAGFVVTAWTIGGGTAMAHADTKASPTPTASVSPMPSDIPGLLQGNGPMPNVNQDDLRWVTDRILCQCGCGLTVTECEFSMPCSVPPRMRYQAAVYLSQGMTPQQTLDQFVKDFGEKVLAAPPKSGFDMIAWTLPFVALVLGGVLVAWAFRDWKHQAPEAERIAPETDPDMLSRIDDEVKKGL